MGYYEIGLPNKWANNVDSKTNVGGILGIFLMALVLVIVSFSCTGPVMGTVLGSLIKDGAWPITAGMCGFGLAMGLPFAVFAMFPSLLNRIPKSGGWMNTVKVIFGIAELALALKFLSLVDLTYHWDIFKYELFLGIWIILAIVAALYLFGFIHFPHDNKSRKITPGYIVTGLVFVAFAVYLVRGFGYDDKTKSYRSLSLISGLAPPTSHNFFLEKQTADQSIKNRYPSYSKCANDLNCFKDYNEGVAYSKEVNKPILLDFTGHACVNCRKVEDNVWSKDSVRNNINDNFVLISLYVDDRKKLAEKEQGEIDITYVDGNVKRKKIRTVGDKWATFETINFLKNTQPLYVLLNSDEELLNTPISYVDIESPEYYNDFLNCGSAAFKNE